jgi:hypothetical protein
MIEGGDYKWLGVTLFRACWPAGHLRTIMAMLRMSSSDSTGLANSLTLFASSLEA